MFDSVEIGVTVMVGAGVGREQMTSLVDGEKGQEDLLLERVQGAVGEAERCDDVQKCGRENEYMVMSIIKG